MANNYPVDSLSNYVTIQTGYSFKSRDFNSAGVPVLKIKNVRAREIDTTEVDFVDKNIASKASQYFVQNGDILISMTGSGPQAPNSVVGRVARYTGSNNTYLINQRVGRFIIKEPEKIDSRYLFFALTQLEYQEKLVSTSTGSANQANISVKQIVDFLISVPPVHVQRAIAGILGALDDKIEVNRHMNATLESMARAVFQKMMNASREGAKEKTIGDVVTIVGGSTPSTTNPTFWDDGDINWATPKDLGPLQSPFLFETNSWITESGLNEISSGLLPVGTVLLSSRAPIGYLAITQIPVAINQGFIAIKCTEEVPNYFVLNWLKENMEEIIGRANGTTFLEISKSNFRPMKINVPPSGKMKAFIETVEPMYQKIVANLKESRTLGSLRDSLLPKLMRGEVRITASQDN